MASTTTNKGIPYAELTDPNNLAYVSQTLAEKVDTLLTTKQTLPELDFTEAGNISGTVDYSLPLKVYSRNNVFSIDGSGLATLTFPAGLFSHGICVFSIINLDSNNGVYISVLSINTERVQFLSYLPNGALRTNSAARVSVFAIGN